jgi:hypothetical protein
VRAYASGLRTAGINPIGAARTTCGLDLKRPRGNTQTSRCCHARVAKANGSSGHEHRISTESVHWPLHLRHNWCFGPSPMRVRFAVSVPVEELLIDYRYQCLIPIGKSVTRREHLLPLANVRPLPRRGGGLGGCWSWSRRRGGSCCGRCA